MREFLDPRKLGEKTVSGGIIPGRTMSNDVVENTAYSLAVNQAHQVA